MERILFNNLVIAVRDDQYLLLNLTSFRRKRITSEEHSLLQTAWEKTLSGRLLERDESNYVHKLGEEKQILSKEVEIQHFSALEKKELEIKAPFPVRSLTFNITHQCNFACDYCYQRMYNMLPEYSGRMTCDDIDIIANYINNPTFLQTELDNVTISGGEPLLPGNEAVINHILDLFPAKETVLFTNGVNIDRFKSRVNFDKIDKFQISLDGPDTTIFEVNHSSVSVKTILNGIEQLLSMGKNVSLAIMWTKSLEHNIETFISLIEKTGFCSNKNFSISINTARDYTCREIIDKSLYDWKYLLDCERKHSQILSTVQAKLVSSIEMGKLQHILFRPINQSINPKTICCRVQDTLPLVFEPNGEIHWCVCLGKDQGIIGNYKSGVIMEDRIKALANRNIFTIQQCRACAFKYLCGGGCVLNNIGSDTPVEAPFCNIYKEPFFLDHLEEFI